MIKFSVAESVIFHHMDKDMRRMSRKCASQRVSEKDNRSETSTPKMPRRNAEIPTLKHKRRNCRDETSICTNAHAQ
jgi:hypothetical protein